MAKRADFMGLWFMPEVTPGVDPGIVAASVVDGATETYKLQPTTTLKAFVRMREKPSGLPKLDLVEIPQTFTTRNYAPCKVRGVQDPGDITIPLVAHGGVIDYGTSGNTGRTQPPPWLALASSALAPMLGNLAAHSGGSATDVDGAGTSIREFDVSAGDVEPGHVIAVDGPGASTRYQIIRPTEGTGQSVTDADYYGAKFGFTHTPANEDPAYFACQIAGDQQFEGLSPTYTVLLQRTDGKASLVLTGVRATSVEQVWKVGEVDQVNLTMTYAGYAYVNSPVEPEPEYYEKFWPCARVAQGAQAVITWDQNTNGVVDAGDVRRDLELESLTFRWNAGYQRRKALTAANGIADISASQPASAEVELTCVYAQEFQDIVGLCCNKAFANISLYFWVTYDDYIRVSDTALRKGASFLCVPSMHQMEDPGSEDEVDNLMYQNLKFEVADWQGDDADFADTGHENTLWVAGIV
jgi:hypothetical protein